MSDSNFSEMADDSDILAHVRNNISPRTVERAAALAELISVHVETENDKVIDEEIDLMLAHILSKPVEGYALAVIGKSGAGKSTILRRRLDANPALMPFINRYGHESGLCLRVKTPPSVTVKSLAKEILAATGYVLERDRSELDLWALVRKRLQLKRYKIIYLDEFQHALKAPSVKGITHLTDTVKILMQDLEWPIWLIIAGVPELLEFISRHEHDQMQRRTVVVEIEGIGTDAQDVETVRSIVEFLAETCQLGIAVPLSVDFIRRLSHGGIYRLGMTIQLIKLAIEASLWDENCQGKLQAQHFIKGYKRLSNCGPDSNVFVSKEWHRILREVDDKGKLTTAFRLEGKKN